MATKKKTSFPKVKKSLKNFLTDESGKITKKDALGLSAGAAIIAGAETAVAGHTSNTGGHLNQGHANGYNAGASYDVTRTDHASGGVNGHYSGTPDGGHANGTRIGSHLNQGAVSGLSHGSHSSHGSHGSGGWC